MQCVPLALHTFEHALLLSTWPMPVPYVGQTRHCHGTLDADEASVQDPVWQEAHSRISALTGQIAKACVQSPLELREVAMTSIQMAQRPQDFGLDAEHAADFCLKLMS